MIGIAISGMIDLLKHSLKAAAFYIILVTLIFIGLVKRGCYFV